MEFNDILPKLEVTGPHWLKYSLQSECCTFNYFQPMRGDEFKTGHMVYNPAYT